ncbi:hypothetical protein Ancab_014775 [Ancistrocladus abbreviatus]
MKSLKVKSSMEELNEVADSRRKNLEEAELVKRIVESKIAGWMENLQGRSKR